MLRTWRQRWGRRDGDVPTAEPGSGQSQGNPGAFTSLSSRTTLTSAHGCSSFLRAFTNHLCYFCAKKNNIKMSDGCAGGSSALGGGGGEDRESLKITVGISRSLSCCLRCPLASAYLSVTRSSWHLSIHLDPCQSVCLSNYPLARQSSPRQRSRQGRRETTAAAPRRGAGAATPAKPRSCGSRRRRRRRAGKGPQGCGTRMRPTAGREKPGWSGRGVAGAGRGVLIALACVCAWRDIRWRYTARRTLWLRQMLHPARGEANPAASPSAGTAVSWAAPAPAALCARAVAWGFFVRGAGQVPPPRLPTGPGSERPPRSKSAAFAYSEQVGAHMPKMHQTKLATIIIIKCAVVLGGGRAWQTSRIIMKLSMCAAVLQQLCLAQQAGNDACYSHPPSPARPPVARSREGCASLGPPRDALGKGA